MCPSNDTFDKTKKNLEGGTGADSSERKSTWDKANISNPKVNRGCAPLTANHISADNVQVSLGPSIPYIPLGVYHTGGFNALLSIRNNFPLPEHYQNQTTNMYVCSCAKASCHKNLFGELAKWSQTRFEELTPQMRLTGHFWWELDVIPLSLHRSYVSLARSL